jgi:hypothetical protein
MDENQKRDAERVHDRLDEAWHKSNDAGIASATLALRTGVVVNGGAAVTLLAFIGGLLKDSKASLSSALPQLSEPLIWFAYGVVASIVGIGLMYLVNFTNTMLLGAYERTFTPPYFVENPSEGWMSKVSYTLIGLAILSYGFSIGFFVYGMFAIKSAIIGGY